MAGSVRLHHDVGCESKVLHKANLTIRITADQSLVADAPRYINRRSFAVASTETTLRCTCLKISKAEAEFFPCTYIHIAAQKSRTHAGLEESPLILVVVSRRLLEL